MTNNKPVTTINNPIIVVRINDRIIKDLEKKGI